MGDFPLTGRFGRKSKDVKAAMTARPFLCAALLVAALPAAAIAFRISDPLAARPADLRIALTLPPGFALLPGSAALKITATDPRSDRAAISSDPLARTGSEGSAQILVLADPEHSQFSALEKRVAEWRAQKVPTAAQIDVTFTPCRTDPSASADGPMALSIQPDARAPKLVLVPAGTTLSAYLGATGPLPDCTKG